MAALVMSVAVSVSTSRPAAANAPQVWPVIEYGMRGSNVIALEALIYELSGFNPGYVNFNWIYDGPEVSWVNAVLGYLGHGQDGIWDGRLGGLLPSITSVGQNSYSVFAAKILLRKSGYAIYDADMFTYTFFDAASMTQFKQHMGLAANGTVDTNTWRVLFWHYQEFKSGQLPSGMCLASPGANGYWANAEAYLWFATLSTHAAGVWGQTLAVTDISSEHGGIRPPHVSHQVGMDFDVRLLFLFHNPCSSGRDIRLNPGSVTDRCVEPHEVRSDYLRADQINQLIASKTQAAGSPFMNYAKRVFFNDCDTITDVNWVAGSGYVQFWENHYGHYHLQYCLIGRSDYNLGGNYSC